MGPRKKHTPPTAPPPKPLHREAADEPATPSRREPCTSCQETFDPAKDPYHRESCREANKP